MPDTDDDGARYARTVARTKILRPAIALMLSEVSGSTRLEAARSMEVVADMLLADAEETARLLRDEAAKLRAKPEPEPNTDSKS